MKALLFFTLIVSLFFLSFTFPTLARQRSVKGKEMVLGKLKIRELCFFSGGCKRSWAEVEGEKGERGERGEEGKSFIAPVVLPTQDNEEDEEEEQENKKLQKKLATLQKKVAQMEKILLLLQGKKTASFSKYSFTLSAQEEEKTKILSGKFLSCSLTKVLLAPGDDGSEKKGGCALKEVECTEKKRCNFELKVFAGGDEQSVTCAVLCLKDES